MMENRVGSTMRQRQEEEEGPFFLEAILIGWVKVAAKAGPLLNKELCISHCATGENSVIRSSLGDRLLP